MKLIISLLVLIIFTISLVHSESKVLKNYVEKYDPNYKWSLNATYDVGYGQVFVLELTSQEWKKERTNNSIWKHWLTICKPYNYTSKHEHGLLHMTDGYNQNWTVIPIDQLSYLGQELCKASNEITSTLFQVPNQYITFDNDGIPRKEDEIVAKTWRLAMDTRDQTFLSLLPQTKSAIAAMNAIQEFGKTKTGDFKLSKFVVSGASKRGWTAYGCGFSGDKRVAAIIPMVIAVGDLVKSIEAQKRAYGNWSFALQSYIEQDIPSFFNTKYFKTVTDIVDPLNYINTLKKVPKFIIIALGDEFFIPLEVRNYYGKLKGEKQLGLFQTSHSITVYPTLPAEITKYFKLIANKIQPPRIKWNIKYSSCKNFGTIDMKVEKGKATKVQVWSANTTQSERLDFRTFACTTSMACIQNITWVAQEIPLSKNNKYSITLTKPASGWTGFYFQVDFSTISTIHSEMAVVPDYYPFPGCTTECSTGKPSWVKNQKQSIETEDTQEDDDEVEFETDSESEDTQEENDEFEF